MKTDGTFRSNLDEFLPQIRRIVQKISRNEGIVDDLTQECCVKIIEKEHLWRSDKGSMTKWINALTRNLTLNYLSRQKKTVALEGDVMAAPEDEKFSEEHISWVLTQFVTLPDRQREILHLRYFEGMKVTEIASKLGVDHSTVSKQISSALVTLKKRARSQGLLALLLPWNWHWPDKDSVSLLNRINIMKLAIISAIIVSITYVNVISENGDSLPSTESLATQSGGQLIPPDNLGIGTIPASTIEEAATKKIEEAVKRVGIDEEGFGATIKGLKIKLEIEPSTWQWSRTKKIKLICTVKNVSDKKIRVFRWGSWDNAGTILQVRDPEGRSISVDGGRDGLRIPKHKSIVELDSGQQKLITINASYIKDALFVPESHGGILNWRMKNNGKHTIRAFIAVQENEKIIRLEKRTSPIWKGLVVSNPVVIDKLRSLDEFPKLPKIVIVNTVYKDFSDDSIKAMLVNERKIKQALQQIQIVQQMIERKTGKRPTTLEELMPNEYWYIKPELFNAFLPGNDTEKMSCTPYSGYLFKMIRGTEGNFTVYAIPQTRGLDGVMSYSINQSLRSEISDMDIREEAFVNTENLNKIKWKFYREHCFNDYFTTLQKFYGVLNEGNGAKSDTNRSSK